MRIKLLHLACVATASLAACAAAPKETTATASDAPSVGRYTGALQPTQQRSGALVVTGQVKAFGTVTIEPTRGGNLDRMRVNLVVTVPGASTSLRWAVLPQRCGSGDLPIIGFDQFPLMDVSSNGRAQVQADLPLPLVPNNAYHVNVYSGGQQLDDVVTCANLKYEVR
jgi:hypothetical protein